MERRGPEKSVGEANSADLEAPRKEHLISMTDDDFGTAASDVANEHRVLVIPDSVEDTEMDEAGFLDPGDGFDRDTSLFLCALDEFRSIPCLANRACCDRPNLCSVGLGKVAHPAQTGDSAIDRLRIELLHFSCTVSDANGFFLASYDFKAVGDGFRDHHVKTIGPDVECSEGGNVRAHCHGASLV